MLIEDLEAGEGADRHGSRAAESQARDTPVDSLTTSPLNILLLVLIAAGIVLRVSNMEMSRSFLFDEHHFVENARGYLKGVKDWNDHPPLGKLTIAAAIRLWGDRPWAWRLPSLVAGLGIVLIGSRIGRRVYGSERAGLLAAALLSVDGFFVAYSKSAVLDGQLTFLSLCTFFVLCGPASRLRFLGAGLLLGLAVSVKISAIALALPVLYFALRAERHRISLVLVAGAAALASHYLTWAYGLSLHHDFTASAPLEETLRLYQHHAGLTKMDNPWTSAWPSWLILSRPLTLHQHSKGEYFFVLHSVGNPLLWFTTTAAVLGASFAIVWRGARQVLRAAGSNSPSERALAGSVPLLVGYLGFLLPWMLSRRDPYIYHYLPAYAFGVIMVGGWVEATLSRFHRTGLVFLCAIAVVAGYFAPVWVPLPLRWSGVEARLFLDGWRK